MSEYDPPSIDADDVRRLVEQHLSAFDAATVRNLRALENRGFSHDPHTRSYVFDLDAAAEANDAPAPHACFLTLSQRREQPADEAACHPHPLALVSELIHAIRSHTEIPISASTLDTSFSTVPYELLLSTPVPVPVPVRAPGSTAVGTAAPNPLSILSLADARRAGLISARDAILLDLVLGKFMGQLHAGVQNDWFGSPLPTSAPPPRDPAYVWQEAFTALLEGLMHAVQSSDRYADEAFPYEEMRRHLSRAIGSFLFDDVEVPSLVWFTGSEDDIYVAIVAPPPSASSARPSGPGEIVAILPNVAHALWGDPLLECLMLGHDPSTGRGSGPSQAFMEGYIGGGGSPVLVFPRHRTKRLWYTIFLALHVLVKYLPLPEDVVQQMPHVEEKLDWAKETVRLCASKLKDAPCY